MGPVQLTLVSMHILIAADSGKQVDLLRVSQALLRLLQHARVTHVEQVEHTVAVRGERGEGAGQSRRTEAETGVRCRSLEGASKGLPGGAFDEQHSAKLTNKRGRRVLTCLLAPQPHVASTDASMDPPGLVGRRATNPAQHA